MRFLRYDSHPDELTRLGISPRLKSPAFPYTSEDTPRSIAGNSIVRHAHRHDAHVVAVPKESVAELFALAERAIDDLKIPLQNDDRYEVSD